MFYKSNNSGGLSRIKYLIESLIYTDFLSWYSDIHYRQTFSDQTEMEENKNKNSDEIKFLQ